MSPRAEAFRLVLAKAAPHWRDLRAGDTPAQIEARYTDCGLGYRQACDLALGACESDAVRYRGWLRDDLRALASSGADVRALLRARLSVAVSIGRLRSLRLEIALLREMSAAAPVWSPEKTKRRRRPISS